jgi:hypothetical protein
VEEITLEAAATATAAATAAAAAALDLADATATDLLASIAQLRSAAEQRSDDVKALVDATIVSVGTATVDGIEPAVVTAALTSVQEADLAHKQAVLGLGEAYDSALGFHDLAKDRSVSKTAIEAEVFIGYMRNAFTAAEALAVTAETAEAAAVTAEGIAAQAAQAAQEAEAAAAAAQPTAPTFIAAGYTKVSYATEGSEGTITSQSELLAGEVYYYRSFSDGHLGVSLKSVADGGNDTFQVKVLHADWHGPAKFPAGPRDA